MSRITIMRNSAQHRALQVGGGVLAVVVLFAIPNQLPAFRVYQLTTVILYAIAVLGLNLLTGYSGQISLGHSAFFALGAYTTALLMLDHGWAYLLTVPVAFAVCFVAGFLLGIPALRLEGLYLALVTLALAVVTPPFVKRFDSITGGSQGRSVPKPKAPEWSGLADDQWQYFVVLGVAALMFLIARNLVKGRVGRAMRAIRDNELAAETMGINLAIFKTLTFAYSAAFAGVGGALFAITVGFVSPESFTVVLAIALLSAMVVGGLASIAGAIFGALYIVFVPEYAADVNDALAGVIYGVSLIVVMFVMPSGAVGLVRRIRSTIFQVWPPSGAEVAAMSPAFAGTAADIPSDLEADLESEAAPGTTLDHPPSASPNTTTDPQGGNAS